MDKNKDKFILKLNVVIFIIVTLIICLFIYLCNSTINKAKSPLYKDTPFINVVKFIDKSSRGIFSSRLTYSEKIEVTKNTKDCYWIDKIKVTDDTAIDLYKYYKTYQDENSYISKKLELINKIITLRPMQPIWYYERIMLRPYDYAPEEIISDYNKIIDLMSSNYEPINTSNLGYRGGKYDGRRIYLENIYHSYFRYLLTHKNSDIITDSMLINIGNEALQRTSYTGKTKEELKEFSNLRAELGNIYLKQHYMWGTTLNYTHSILLNPFENDMIFIKYGSIFTYDAPEKSAFFSLADCVKESSFKGCETAINRNRACNTGFTFIPYVKLGDLNYNLKDYISALKNYEQALEELEYHCNFSEDIISYSDLNKYKFYIRQDIKERINKIKNFDK